MSNTLILVITSIVVLFLLLPFLFFFRRRVEIRLEGDTLLLDYPLSTKEIDLDQELVNWRLQKGHYLKLGTFYSIDMQFKNGKRHAVSSILNQENYILLYHYLQKRFPERQEPEQKMS